MKNAVLITIGNEVLSGTTVDTNSNFIAKELSRIGISVSQIFTISDEIEIIKNTLQSAFQLTDLVITTGGLGPTKDDKTKKAFCECRCNYDWAISSANQKTFASKTFCRARRIRRIQNFR